MRPTTVDPKALLYKKSFVPSDETIGFESARRLLIIGCSCLIIVFIFGVILCRLDISAGKRRRANANQEYVPH